MQNKNKNKNTHKFMLFGRCDLRSLAERERDFLLLKQKNCKNVYNIYNLTDLDCSKKIHKTGQSDLNPTNGMG